MKGATMDFNEKAKIRIEHWIKHSEDHLQEYAAFAKELEDAGKTESARYISEMVKLTKESNDCLAKAKARLSSA